MSKKRESLYKIWRKLEKEGKDIYDYYPEKLIYAGCPSGRYCNICGKNWTIHYKKRERRTAKIELKLGKLHHMSNFIYNRLREGS